MPPHPANFVFLVEMGFLNVSQAGLDLLTSGDLPTSASQSAEMTGMSHHAWPKKLFFKLLYILGGLVLWGVVPSFVFFLSFSFVF